MVLGCGPLRRQLPSGVVPQHHYFAASARALREARALRRSRILEAKRSRAIAWHGHVVVATPAYRPAGPCRQPMETLDAA